MSPDDADDRSLITYARRRAGEDGGNGSRNEARFHDARAAARPVDRDERRGARCVPGRAADLPAGHARLRRPARLARDPRAAAVIDAGHHYAELHGVEIEGEAAAVGPVPQTDAADLPELAEPERLMAVKYFGQPDMPYDGRHAWLRITPTKITSWDFRKLAGLS
jgi:hypothetical protein